MKKFQFKFDTVLLFFCCTEVKLLKYAQIHLALIDEKESKKLDLNSIGLLWGYNKKPLTSNFDENGLDWEAYIRNPVKTIADKILPEYTNQNLNCLHCNQPIITIEQVKNLCTMYRATQKQEPLITYLKFLNYTQIDHGYGDSYIEV